jgi:hypothetical protein
VAEDDEAPAVETFEQRRNKQLRKEIEEADQAWVRGQKLVDYLWEQKLLSEASLDDNYVEIGGFRERRYRTSCHVGKHDTDFGQH